MGACNFTIPMSECTLETCCIEVQGFVDYLPTLAGNAIYLVIFLLLGLLQLGLAFRYRTWGFSFAMTIGCLLEVVSYAGRIKMHKNIFDQAAFIIYLTPNVIGPVFVAAGMYLCLSRIVTVYGHGLSRFRPSTYTVTFITFDIFSLLLQTIGGAVSASSDSQKTIQTGVDVLVAGLAFQVFSMFMFILVGLDFAWRVYKFQGELEPKFAPVQKSTKWKCFLGCLSLGVVTIFVRCIYRCAELSQGFGGKLANDEVTFMILEGPMVFIAVGGLTIFHPGFAFMGRWADAGWSLRKGKPDVEELEVKTSQV